MLRSDSDQEIPDESAVGSVEALLEEIALWPDSAASADLWVPNDVTLNGNAVAPDVAIAALLDRALSGGWFPNGFSTDSGGRLYHYKRE